MIGNPCCKLEASATFHDGEIMGINDKGQAPFWSFGKKLILLTRRALAKIKTELSSMKDFGDI